MKSYVISVFWHFKLSNHCVAVSEVASHKRLRSATHHQLLLIQRYRLGTFGHFDFAVAGPTFWNLQINCELTLVIGLNQL